MQPPPPLWSIALGLILLGGAATAFVPRGTPAFGGPFALTDAHGATVTDVSLRGQPFVVFFGFTRCPSVCPRTLARLTRLRRALGPDGDTLKVLFVSVDPQDTAADVERYLQAFPLPTTGLVGSREERERMVAAYHVFASGAGPTTSHTGTVFLVGARGEPVGTLEPLEADDTSLAKLRALLARER